MAIDHTVIEKIIQTLSSSEKKIEAEASSNENIISSNPEKLEKKAWGEAEEALANHELLQLLKLNNEEVSDGIKFRRVLIFSLLRLTEIWLAFIAIVVLLQGLNKIMIPFTNGYTFAFHLEPSVLITLLGATTVTVVGLFATATTHTFYKTKK